MPYHLLLADDDPYFRREFREFMEDLDIVEAPNGEEVLNILKKPNDIDLIVLDERLPDTSGTDLLKKIHEIAPHTRAAILTGYGSKEVAIDAVKSHATDYIEKPLTSQKIARIRELILSAPHGQKDRSVGGLKGKIEQAKYFVQRNYDKKLTLKDVADEVCLSPKYLSRVFKKHAGTSFVDYKLRLRMEKAKELLKDSGYNIEQISVKLGYQNPESFGKIFRQHTSESPRAYRERDRRRMIRALSQAIDGEVKPRASSKEDIERIILDTSKDAVVEYDVQGNIIFWSESAEKMYGWQESEILKKNIFETLSVEKRAPFIAALRQLRARKAVHSLETRRIKKNGEALDIWMIIIPELDKGGRLKRFITVERKFARRRGQKTDDIIKEKDMELDQARHQLAQERHMAGLGRFASVIAHEVRHLIGCIQMAAWNIKKKVKDPSVADNIACIEEMVGDGSQIINNILNYSHIKIPCCRNVVIVNLLDQCIASAQKCFPARNVQLRKGFRGLGRKRFSTDPVQFKQVVFNIITNAYEAIPNGKMGKITVRAGVGKNWLTLKVTDNGKGMARDDLARVYEPFFTKKHKGIGLGLSVCREIIALYNGRIFFDSKVNKGTTVTVQLPLKKAH